MSGGKSALTPPSTTTINMPTPSQGYQRRLCRNDKGPDQASLIACPACRLNARSIPPTTNHPKAQPIQISHAYNFPARARPSHITPKIPCPITKPSHMKPNRPMRARTWALPPRTPPKVAHPLSAPHRHRAMLQPCQKRFVTSVRGSPVHIPSRRIILSTQSVTGVMTRLISTITNTITITCNHIDARTSHNICRKESVLPTLQPAFRCNSSLSVILG